jgi:hypothetical protein
MESVQQDYDNFNVDQQAKSEEKLRLMKAKAEQY